MMLRPNERLTRLVEAAFSERPVSDLGALTARESLRLAQLTRMALLLRAEKFACPPEVADSAKALFSRTEAVLMRIVTSTFQAAGARGQAADVVHVAYEAESDSVRLMYVRETRGWRVVGQAPGPGWTVVCGEDVVVVDEEGRFELLSPGASMPSLSLHRDGRTLSVSPPGREP